MKEIAITVVLLFACGCQQAVDFSAFENQNNKKTLIIARNYLPVGVSHIAFADGLKVLPRLSIEANEVVIEYLGYAEDPNNLTDYELVKSLGQGIYIRKEFLLLVVPELSRYLR